jgi:peptide-methionine (S)-S-oxide reductase
MYRNLNIPSEQDVSDAASAHCDIVSTGQTGHAESVQVTFDAQKISYGQILKYFWTLRTTRRNSTGKGPIAVLNIVP